MSLVLLPSSVLAASTNEKKTREPPPGVTSLGPKGGGVKELGDPMNAQVPGRQEEKRDTAEKSRGALEKAADLPPAPPGVVSREKVEAKEKARDDRAAGERD